VQPAPADASTPSPTPLGVIPDRAGIDPLLDAGRHLSGWLYAKLGRIELTLRVGPVRRCPTMIAVASIVEAWFIAAAKSARLCALRGSIFFGFCCRRLVGTDMAIGCPHAWASAVVPCSSQITVDSSRKTWSDPCFGPLFCSVGITPTRNSCKVSARENESRSC
jgi:hypothetical protein